MNLRNSLIAQAIVLLVAVSPSFATESIITESEGTACLSSVKTRQEAERATGDEARKNASADAREYLTKEIGQGVAEQYAMPQVKIHKELQTEWTKTGADECLRIRIRAEVMTDDRNSGVKKILHGYL